MSFKKSLEPSDKFISSFEVHKNFTLTEADSGSGLYSVPLVKGSDSNLYGFDTSTATSKTILNNTFYNVPSWHSVNRLYYKDITQMRGYIDYNRAVPTSSNAVEEYTSENVLNNTTLTLRRPHTRKLHNTANVISIPQQLYGQRIKPESLRIVDNSTSSTFILKDDGYGNVYDVAYSSSFAKRTPDINNSGSLVGNIFYDDGLVVITDTGSYSSVGTGTGANGYSVKFDSSQVIYEREFTCHVLENEFTHTTNKSLKVGYSSSFDVPTLTKTLFTNTIYDKYPYEVFGYATNSYDPNGYTAGTELIGEATHSDFNTYITTIGLYNDEGDLLAIGKPSKPIKNEKEMDLTFIVRFDTN
tara:strand:+ start:66 stop:1136 length:1071 start_codon:yes stop_codon:yes gene_type:complete